MRGRFTRRWFWQRGVALSALLIALVGGALTLTAAQDVNPLDVATVLATEQDAEDVVPFLDDIEGVMIVSESTRMLHSNEDASFWLAMDTDTNACLIVRLEANSQDWVVATSCVPGAPFDDGGLWLRVQVAGAGVDATVLTDRFDSAHNALSVSQAGGVVAAKNLIVFEKDSRPDSLILVTTDGERFDFGRR